MAITYFANQNNPQQNPVYQAQQQIVSTQQPVGGDQDAGETFLQRQQRKFSARPVTEQTNNPGPAPNLQAPAPSATSVTSNGRLSTAPAPQPQPVSQPLQPQAQVAPGLTPMPAQVAPPTSPDPFQGQGFWTGQQWVPKNHPLAQPAQPGQPGATQPGAPATQFPGLPQLPANATYYADNLGNTPFSTYQAQQFNQQGLPTYQGGQINAPQLGGYQAGQISQFAGPNQQAIQGSTEALIQQILNNPLSMSDQNVAGLKEQQKAQILAMQRQGMEQAAQSAASRGLAPGSGALAGRERRIEDQGRADLTGAYRDIDLAKMVQDQQDRTGAAQLGDSYLSSQMGRATQGYQATLAGQQLREQTGQAAADDARLRAALDIDVQGRNLDERFRGHQSEADARKFGFDVERAQADEGFRGFQSEQDAQKNALQRAISQAGLNQQAADSGLKGFGLMMDAYNAQQGRGLEGRQLDIQEKLGQGGLDLDRSKLTETGRQFDKGYHLDFLRYLLDQQQLGQQGSQFNQSLGLDWFKANSANTNNWLGLLP